jgi:hypothetical protein
MESTFELLDNVEAQIFWMLDFAAENDIPAERLRSLNHLVIRTRAIFQDLKNLEARLRVQQQIKSSMPIRRKVTARKSDDKEPS